MKVEALLVGVCDYLQLSHLQNRPIALLKVLQHRIANYPSLVRFGAKAASVRHTVASRRTMIEHLRLNQHPYFACDMLGELEPTPVHGQKQARKRNLVEIVGSWCNAPGRVLQIQSI